MAWIESHQTLANHRKTLQAQAELGCSTPEIIGHLHLLWWWVLDNAPTGDISHISDGVIARASQWAGDATEFVTALVHAGFIDDDDGGSKAIHDWYDYAGRLINKRQANAKRMKEQRANAVRGTCNAQSAHVQDTINARAGATVPDPTGPNRTQPTAVAVPPNPQPPETPAAAATQDSPGNVETISKDKPAATIKDQLGEIVTIYEQNFGLLNPLIGDRLKDMMAEYGETFTRDALIKAGTQPANKRHLNYVAAILKGWAAEGRGPPGYGNNGHGQKRDTLEEDLKKWSGR